MVEIICDFFSSRASKYWEFRFNNQNKYAIHIEPNLDYWFRNLNIVYSPYLIVEYSDTYYSKKYWIFKGIGLNFEDPRNETLFKLTWL